MRGNVHVRFGEGPKEKGAVQMNRRTSLAVYSTKQGALEAVVLPHAGFRQAYRVRRSTLEKFIGSPVQLAEVKNK